MGEVLKRAIKDNRPFWVLTIASVMLILLGLFLPWPPDGTVDGSIIAGVGELMGWGAIWAFVRAIDAGLDARIKHKNTTITVGNNLGDGDANCEIAENEGCEDGCEEGI